MSRGSGLDKMPGRRLDQGLSTRSDTELAARIFEMKLDGALAQSQNFPDLPECFAAGGPGERLDFAFTQADLLGPDRTAGHARKPRRDQRRKHVVVHGLGKVVVGTQVPALELAVMVAQRS